MAEMKFEKALQRLEQIVGELEKGELDIDKSLQIFEEGIKMSRICSKKLQEAEQKIEKLTRNQKGELVAELFGGEAVETGGEDDDEDDDDDEEENE
jgi:exodeoxyribonuclease VII small subunit